MAYGIKKTEAGKRNGNGRWCPRAEAKKGAKKARRVQDKKVARDG